MEICHTIIMFVNVFPYLYRVLVMAIEGSIYEFYLWHFLINKELQFRFYQIQITETQFLIYRR